MESKVVVAEQIKAPEPFDIFVPSYNRLDLTMRCIDAIYAHTRTPFHLIVADASNDLTPLYLEALAKERDNITYIHSPVNWKEGNQFFNLGLAQCKTPYMAVMMNSVRVEPEWELSALDIMKTNSKIGIIGLKCLMPNGLIESAGIKMVKWLPTDIGRDQASHRFTAIYEADAVQWALCLLRKEAVYPNVLEEGVFHGHRGWDDIDNCFVLKSKGWKVFYCGYGCGYHEPRASRGDNSALAAQQNKENGERFYKRWGFWDDFCKQQPVDDIHKMPVNA